MGHNTKIQQLNTQKMYTCQTWIERVKNNIFGYKISKKMLLGLPFYVILKELWELCRTTLFSMPFDKKGVANDQLNLIIIQIER